MHVRDRHDPRVKLCPAKGGGSEPRQCAGSGNEKSAQREAACSMQQQVIRSSCLWQSLACFSHAKLSKTTELVHWAHAAQGHVMPLRHLQETASAQVVR